MYIVVYDIKGNNYYIIVWELNFFGILLIKDVVFLNSLPFSRPSQIGSLTTKLPLGDGISLMAS